MSLPFRQVPRLCFRDALFAYRSVWVFAHLEDRVPTCKSYSPQTIASWLKGGLDQTELEFLRSRRVIAPPQPPSNERT
jgi:hypothetical protein